MRQGPLYLKISIFYPASSWSTLINKGLKPFVNRYSNNPYTLRLNDEQGDNVRFAFATNSTEFERIAGELHQHLHQFLQIHPSEDKRAPCRQSLFIDFPTNSIRYDLFDHIPFLFECRNKVINIDDFLAEFWGLMVSTDASVLDEVFKNRYVFSVQLFFTLLFCFSKDAKHANAILDHVRKLLRDKEASLTEELKNVYAGHLIDIPHLARETWMALSAKDSNKHFLSPVKKIFDKLANSAKTLKEDQRCLLFYQVMKRLNNDLGLLDDMLIIYYFKKTENFRLGEN